MADLLNHLQRNLEQAEALGQTERVKALKKRIAELDKLEPVEEPVEDAPAKKSAAKKASK